MGLISKVGGFINDLTGATSAGAQSQKYALQSATINNQYQKEFAQNAHQWEVADLKAAGLNPILSAGGSGTSASGGGVNSATVNSAGYSPLDIFQAGVNALTGIQNAKKIASEKNYTDEQTNFTKLKGLLETKKLGIETKMSEAQLKKIDKEILEISERILKTKGGSIAEKLGTDVYTEGKDLLTDIKDAAIRGYQKGKEKQNKK